MILAGIAKLAFGNPKGADEFGGTTDAFNASLAPLIALTLVCTLINCFSGRGWKLALLEFVLRFCTMLFLPVLIYEFSRRYNRQALWIRTAAAMNWCQWLIFPVAFVGIILIVIAGSSGVPVWSALVIIFGLAGLYMLWNQWFVLKSGLKITGWRALLILLVNTAATVVILLLPLTIFMKLTGMSTATLS